MKDLRRIKAVVFDLDGTLLNTLLDIGAGANMALHRSGLPEHTMAEYRRLVGHGIRNLFRLAVPENTPESVYDEALSYYLSYYPEHCADHTDYFPGIQQMLNALHENGYRLGILSNKTEATSRKIIAQFFPDVPFALVWGNNGTRPLKPQTDAGYALCEALSLRADEIAYVGDGDTDMEFASKMGFFALGVTWGYRDRDELIAAGADVLADTAEQITETLCASK